MKNKQSGLTLLSLLIYLLVLAALISVGVAIWNYTKSEEERKQQIIKTQMVIKQLDQLQNINQEWEPALRLAASTSRIALAPPVQRMQDLRSKVRNQATEGCVSDVKRNLLMHMDLTIEAFLEFMQDHDSTSSELLSQAKRSGEIAHNYLNECSRNSKSTLNKLSN